MCGDNGNNNLQGRAGNDVLTANADHDWVSDYATGTGTLGFVAAHWSGIASTADIAATFANVTLDGVKFDFGDGNVLILAGLVADIVGP